MMKEMLYRLHLVGYGKVKEEKENGRRKHVVPTPLSGIRVDDDDDQ
jgi:hypothetical protein